MSKRIEKPDTASALDAAREARADAKKTLNAKRQAFTDAPSPAAYAAEVQAENDVGYHDRVLALAQAAHDAFLQAAAEAEAARLESERLAALKSVTDELDANQAEACSLVVGLAGLIAKKIRLCGEAQVLGGAGVTAFGGVVTDAAQNALIALSVHPSCIQVSS